MVPLPVEVVELPLLLEPPGGAGLFDEREEVVVELALLPSEPPAPTEVSEVRGVEAFVLRK